jgi:hypothetical protein
MRMTRRYTDFADRDTDRLSERVAACVADIADWMRSNRLRLNIDKTGLLWCSSPQRQHQLPSAPLTLGGSDVTASSMVRKLGVIVDLDLSLQHHVEVVTARCFAALRQLSRLCFDDVIAGNVTDPYTA